MTAPVLEDVWTFDVNNQFVQQSLYYETSRHANFSMKEALVGLGWSVIASRDNAGTTKNVGDADPDTWGSVSDILGFNDVWIVLRSSDLGMSLGLQARSSTYSHRMYITLYHLDDVNTDGGVNLPTATGGVTITINDGGQFTTGESTYNCAGTVHAMKPSDGKGIRLFCVSSYNSNAYGASSIIIDKVVDTPDSVDEAYMVWGEQAHQMDWNGGAGAQSPMVSIFGGNTSGRVIGIYDTGSGRTVETACRAGTIVGASAGNVIYSLNYIPPTQPPFTLYGSDKIAQSMWLNNSALGVVGRVRDMWLVSSDTELHTTYPADASRQFIKIGDLMLPWNGSVPLLSGGPADEYYDVSVFESYGGGGGGQNIRDIPKLVRSVP